MRELNKTCEENAKRPTYRCKCVYLNACRDCCHKAILKSHKLLVDVVVVVVFGFSRTKRAYNIVCWQCFEYRSFFFWEKWSFSQHAQGWLSMGQNDCFAEIFIDASFYKPISMYLEANIYYSLEFTFTKSFAQLSTNRVERITWWFQWTERTWTLDVENLSLCGKSWSY